MATEIYICKEGQSLKQGKIEYGEIDSKVEAQSDAVARCKRDQTIAKIAYYSVNEDGDFRIFFTYNNPHLVSGRQTPDPDGEAAPKKKKKGKKKKKKSLLSRLLSPFS